MTAPRQLLSVGDGVFLTVGMVIGVGIFKAPSIVAGNTSGPAAFLLAWLLGGVISVCGALVYADPAIIRGRSLPWYMDWDPLADLIMQWQSRGWAQGQSDARARCPTRGSRRPGPSR